MEEFALKGDLDALRDQLNRHMESQTSTNETTKEDVTNIKEIPNSIGGEYNPKKPYEKDEYCMFNGNLYQFIQTYGKGIEPTNSTYWVACDVATELNKLIKMIKGV